MSMVPFCLPSSPAGGVLDSLVYVGFPCIGRYSLGLFSLADWAHIYLVTRPARGTLRVGESLCLLHTSERQSSSLSHILYTHPTANKPGRNGNKEDRLGKAVREQGEARAQEDQETGRGRRASGRELNNHAPRPPHCTPVPTQPRPTDPSSHLLCTKNLILIGT